MIKQKGHSSGNKVLVAMSGGVDSSVAAWLLKEEGFEVEGVTMNLGAAGGRGATCGSTAVEDARRVCETIGIAHRVVDYCGLLEEKVLKIFVAEYARGRTPNPCIECNRHLKFGALLRMALSSGFDYLATGHYARIEKNGDLFFLKRPKDRKKDQTYFLYQIQAQALRFVRLPLGSLMKDEVRDMAGRADLRAADRKESQDLCFLGKGMERDFFAAHGAPMEPGPITDIRGRTLGTHRGIVFYTIGQRGGLGISHGIPLYVTAIQPEANRIVVGERALLKAAGLVAGDLNFLVAFEDWPSSLSAKIRYRKKEVSCRASFRDGALRVHFDEALEAVTPGQSVVVYDGDTVLGGGVIENVIRS